MPRESEIISRIRNLARAGKRVRVSIGDDAAVVDSGGGLDLITCCDVTVEGVHFRTEWGEPRLAGRKAMAVTLSDVAAMGGVARFAMISMAIPHGLQADFTEQLIAGLLDMAEQSGIEIIGGDTSGSPGAVFIDTIAIGECQPGKAVTRAGAKAGDKIFVTGHLGASALGLSLLEQGYRLNSPAPDLSDVGKARQEAIFKHLNPEPRLRFGRAIGEAGLATSMIDISDGLSTDLWHILEESGCGAVISASRVPIVDCVTSLVEDRPAALRLALHGGEEYELLFTVSAGGEGDVRRIAEEVGLIVTEVGAIVPEQGLLLDDEGTITSLKPAGFEHSM